MTQRDPRYDALFQPMQIGPVIAPNRFFQVPHCTGMGAYRPRTLASMRAAKAEGGWGVVCTEYNSIHPTSDDLPHPSATLWNDSDIRAHRLMTDQVHMHGALAGAELWYGGMRTANLHTREVSMDVTHAPNSSGHPFQARMMDKTDIKTFRKWHRDAALRAREAEFDIVYVYATHGYLVSNFLNPTLNQRGDEYGGSLENRTRLMRELIEETKDAVGDRCAVAVRFAADETIGEDGQPIIGERREMFEMLQHLPDLWDINIADYSLEMGVSRFVKEAPLEPYMNWVKSVTDKPVVTVGRFTSPDTMASQIKRGITDFVGAARPSIADPFLPNKIRDGRVDEIRECIGCNMCYSGDTVGVPIRCTQNPTMGEEWRRGWHPEHVDQTETAETVLVVGAGPAGLEAARVAGKRGFNVMLTEASRELGGRVTRESSLPGMGEYARVRNYREQTLALLPNVEIFRESPMTAQDILDVEADHVILATGSSWRTDRFDEGSHSVIPEGSDLTLYTPDDIMDGNLPGDGPVIVYDADGYYMGGVIAERLHQEGLDVRLVTPSDVVSAWAENTSERWRIRSHLMKLGIKITTNHSLIEFDGEQAHLECTYSEQPHSVPAASVVMVTYRTPRDELYHELLATGDGTAESLPFTLHRIGDAEAPAVIAAAVLAGHKCAQYLGRPEANIMRHDRVDVGETSEPSPQDAASAEYLSTLTRYFEEEIEGEAYFRQMSDRLNDAAERGKMTLLADVERFAAQSVEPLLAKYGLTPACAKSLRAKGQSEADSASTDWAIQIQDMRDSFPGYVDDFKALEAMAPAADLPRLKILTEHETAAIEFLEREAAGQMGAENPLLTYLGRRL